jgi:hypothetical protein
VSCVLDEAPAVVEQAQEADPPEAASEGPEAPDPCAPFLTADGRQLRVTATLDPVFEAKGFTRIGFRLIQRVMSVRYNGEDALTAQQVSQLSTAELLRVDLATIARGVDRLQAEAAQQLSLIVPISYTSLASMKGRGEVVARLKDTGGLVKLGVICEILDVDGVPPSILLAAVSLVKPFALLVVGRLADTDPKAILRLEGTGLQALSFECPPDLGEPEFQAWAAGAVTAAKRVAKAVLVYGAGTPARAGILAALGASHVSVGAA